MLFRGKSHLCEPGAPMDHTGRLSYATNRNTNGGYPGSVASELSSDVAKVTSDASELSFVAS